eukprot:gene12643-biopygen6983
MSAGERDSTVSSAHPKVYRNQIGFEHEEPMCGPGDGSPQVYPCPFKYNPYIAFYTAAWFKVYLHGGRDVSAWHDLIYNENNPASLCKYADMKECILAEK